MTIRCGMILLCLVYLVVGLDDGWVWNHFNASKTLLLENVLLNGAVLASPSKCSPDYYFHWVRDAALVTSALTDLWIRERGSNDIIPQVILKMADFNLQIQTMTETPCQCLGEPKWNVDGRAYTANWGRPQNDGPALRALAFIKFYENYGPSSLTKLAPLIKTDLEYVAKVWREPCFDLWEEVYGNHFHTRVVMYAALSRSSSLPFLDTVSTTYYSLQAKELLKVIQSEHLASDHILATVNVTGWTNKISNLDVSTILGVIQAGNCAQDVFPNGMDLVFKTATKLANTMASLYPINRRYPDIGPALGRYPEDTYDGTGNSQGNPWFLATLAVSEFYYKASLKEPHIADQRRGVFSRSKLFDAAEALVARVRKHASLDGHLSEEMNRETGFMTGAVDLSWSYAAFLTAILARQEALSKLDQFDD
ncbi:glucan 1,4-alpha-glucosidase [Synchytrium microbalum]|uniref:glucan 1,4-alpha-glucosidase n=1 Tax=Synchytrium microbalum TaxID=1806994 RepID=A0A507C9Y6_9FUNG|nr:glucan 1,4-alpha-glucosidase [Synchytrium microbalum]TPX34315.1 glucan 1,4-alpha-glucosidase [Synchytrium microbalum]